MSSETLLRYKIATLERTLEDCVRVMAQAEAGLDSVISVANAVAFDLARMYNYMDYDGEFDDLLIAAWDEAKKAMYCIAPMIRAPDTRAVPETEKKVVLL